MNRHIPAALIMSNFLFTMQRVQRFSERSCEIGGADRADDWETIRVIFTHSSLCDIPFNSNCVVRILYGHEKKFDQPTMRTWCNTLSKIKVYCFNQFLVLPSTLLVSVSLLFSSFPFFPILQIFLFCLPHITLLTPSQLSYSLPILPFTSFPFS